MPQKIPKKLQRQIDKSIKALEKKDDKAPEAPKVVLEEIPDSTFRKVDANYQPFYHQFKQHYLQQHPDEEKPKDETMGYVQIIPQAPGYVIDIQSPEYPRVNGEDFQPQPDMKYHPIIVVRNQSDIDHLMKFKLFKDPAEIREIVEKHSKDQRNLWILPNGHSIDCARSCTSLQQAIEDKQLKQAETEMEEVDKQKEVKTEDLYKNVKKIFWILLAAIIVFIAGYIWVQNRFFDHTFGGRSINQLYKTLGVSPSATEEVLKKAYRKLALKLHPDRNPGCVDCNAQFNRIADAYKAILESRENKDIPTILGEEGDWLAHQPKGVTGGFWSRLAFWK